MIVWTKFKFAAGLAALLILVAGTATIAAQKAAQSKRDAASEARRSTPIGALRYLLDAFAAYDGEKIVDSHDTNAPAIRRMVFAITNSVTAEGRLRKALEDKFQSSGGMGKLPAVQMASAKSISTTQKKKSPTTPPPSLFPNGAVRRKISSASETSGRLPIPTAAPR